MVNGNRKESGGREGFGSRPGSSEDYKKWKT